MSEVQVSEAEIAVHSHEEASSTTSGRRRRTAVPRGLTPAELEEIKSFGRVD
jgi:hypothetical protein